MLPQELGPAPVGHTPPANPRLRALVRRAWAPLLALACFGVLQNVDVIVVKHRTNIARLVEMDMGHALVWTRQ